MEEKTPQTGITPAPGDAPPPPPEGPPPEEEPPKIEEIVTDDVLRQIINGYNSELSLVSWEAKLGTKVGDNYMSIMYAVELELKNKNGSTEKLDIMLKTIPRNVFRQDMINEMKAFKKEATLYEQVLPCFIKTQQERAIHQSDLFSAWPTCYATHLDEKTDFLAMENLKVAGYTMGSRVKGLDFNHCAVVLRNLARYHAISYVKFGGSREKIVEAYPMLSDGMFTKGSKVSEMQQQFFKQSFKSQGEGLKGKGEDFDLAASRLAKLSEADVFTILGDLMTKDLECAVVTHGDCWVNNMLFKYRETDKKESWPISVKFIDFQLATASSRLVDVYYFLMTSAMLDVLNEREDDLLMMYYTEFTGFAQKLGIDTKEKKLTWQNFLKEADKFRVYGIFLGLLLAPMLAADSADIPDMESFTEEDMKNTDETMSKFYKDITNEYANRKAKTLVLTHLPKCKSLAQFL